jgi:hypothetical protein
MLQDRSPNSWCAKYVDCCPLLFFNLVFRLIPEPVCVNQEADVARKPANATFVEAASLPTVALTGLQALIKGNVSAKSKERFG